MSSAEALELLDRPRRRHRPIIIPNRLRCVQETTRQQGKSARQPRKSHGMLAQASATRSRAESTTLAPARRDGTYPFIPCASSGTRALAARLSTAGRGHVIPPPATV